MTQALDKAVSAILGNPYDPNKEPDREGTVEAFALFDQMISVIANAVVIGAAKAYASKSAADADVGNMPQGSFAVTYNNPVGVWYKQGGIWNDAGFTLSASTIALISTIQTQLNAITAGTTTGNDTLLEVYNFASAQKDRIDAILADAPTAINTFLEVSNALAGKANSNHTHAYSSLTGRPILGTAAAANIGDFADAADLASKTDIEVGDAYLSESLGRAGDQGRGKFSQQIDGPAASRQPITFGTYVNTQTFGRCLEISGDDVKANGGGFIIVAYIIDIPFDNPLTKYNIRFAAEKTKQSVDDAGEGLECHWRNLNYNAVGIANSDYRLGPSAPGALDFVRNGLPFEPKLGDTLDYAITVSRTDDDDVTIVLPPSTRYGVMYFKLFHQTGAVAIAALQPERTTIYKTVVGDIGGLAAAVAELDSTKADRTELEGLQENIDEFAADIDGKANRDNQNNAVVNKVIAQAMSPYRHRSSTYTKLFEDGALKSSAFIGPLGGLLLILEQMEMPLARPRAGYRHIPNQPIMVGENKVVLDINANGEPEFIVSDFVRNQLSAGTLDTSVLRGADLQSRVTSLRTAPDGYVMTVQEADETVFDAYQPRQGLRETAVVQTNLKFTYMPIYGQSLAYAGGDYVTTLRAATYPRHNLTYVNANVNGDDRADLSQWSDLNPMTNGEFELAVGHAAMEFLERQYRSENKPSPGRVFHHQRYGGQPIEQFVPGTNAYMNLIDSYEAFPGVAARYGRLNIGFTLLWVQGENGGNNYQTTLDNLFTSIRADVLARTGVAVTQILMTQSNTAAVDPQPIYQDIGQQQRAVARLRQSYVTCIGPMYQFPLQLDDNIHPTEIGKGMFGELLARVYKQRIDDGANWKPLDLIASASITYSAADELTVTWLLPIGTSRLAFDDDWIGVNCPCVDRGFKWTDDSGVAKTITSITLFGVNRVKIKFSANLPTTGVRRLSYAQLQPIFPGWASSRGEIYASTQQRSDVANVISAVCPVYQRDYALRFDEVLP